jgi:hypothetical protein
LLLHLLCHTFIITQAMRRSMLSNQMHVAYKPTPTNAWGGASVQPPAQMFSIFLTTCPGPPAAMIYLFSTIYKSRCSWSSWSFSVSLFALFL